MPPTSAVKTSVVDRFLRYVTYDTQSAENIAQGLRGYRELLR